jgi:UDP-3-O-[3-hydroxymyristoyl] N-acetylglucosamine deacetylase
MEDREFLESEIIKARTFGWFEDRERLCKIGLARGVSEENTIIIMPDGSLYNNGLRSKNEFIAHKALDIIGDFSIMGTVIGEIRAKNPSHRLNHKMIKLCLSDRESQSCDQYHLL